MNIETIHNKDRRKISRLIAPLTISVHYIHYALKTFKRGYVYRDTHGLLIGICLWTIEYILPITGKSYIIMNALIAWERPGFSICQDQSIHTYCLKHRIDYIRLESEHQDRDSYYESYGFHLYNPMDHRMIMESKKMNPVNEHETLGV